MTGDHYQMVSGFFMFKIRIIFKKIINFKPNDF